MLLVLGTGLDDGLQWNAGGLEKWMHIPDGHSKFQHNQDCMEAEEYCMYNPQSIAKLSTDTDAWAPIRRVETKSVTASIKRDVQSTQSCRTSYRLWWWEKVPKANTECLVSHRENFVKAPSYFHVFSNDTGIAEPTEQTLNSRYSVLIHSTWYTNVSWAEQSQAKKHNQNWGPEINSCLEEVTVNGLYFL